MQVARSLRMAIINQPIFTSFVATGVPHPAIHSSYATEQLRIIPYNRKFLKDFNFKKLISKISSCFENMLRSQILMELFTDFSYCSEPT